jgi:transposase-like protein
VNGHHIDWEPKMAALAAILESREHVRRRRGRPRDVSLIDQQLRVAYLRLKLRMPISQLCRMTGRSRTQVYAWIDQALKYDDPRSDALKAYAKAS